MSTDTTKRKMAAIFSADVKGYSRLMGEDEVGTIRVLQSYRQVMSDLIQKKGGRVVDSPGDNVIAEFASVLDALESAVDIQRELKVRNADRSESRRMEFRIGINLFSGGVDFAVFSGPLDADVEARMNGDYLLSHNDNLGLRKLLTPC